MMSAMFSHFGAVCPGGDFLGFPKWYKYLQGANVPLSTGSVNNGTVCVPQVTSLSDVWLIVAAIIELLLRIGALAAVAFVIYGGIQYLISQGDPAKTAQARTTIINAVIGLVIAVIAAAVVSFIARSFT